MFSITDHNRKWWLLAAMTAALSLVFIDQTALSVSLPSIQRELGISHIQLQWVMNAYLLALATLVVFGGKLGDMLGHRQTFLIGITLFTLSSLSCALAHSSTSFILSRFSEGIGGAFMIPATSAMLARTFPDAERGRAIGLYIGIASVFLALGPIFGGLLTQYFSWRWVFWMNVPPTLTAVVLTLLAHPESEPKQSLTMDWMGFGLFTLAVLSFIVALMETVDWGWTSPYTLSLLSGSLVLITAFWRHSKRITQPFIELHFFRNRSFLYSTIILILIQTVSMVLIFWVIFLQDVLRFPPSVGGLATLPIMLPLMFMAPIGGNLRDKYGPRLPMFWGCFFVTCSIGWIATVAHKQSYLWLLPGFLIYGLSMPLIGSNCMATALSSVQPEEQGLANGILSGIRQLGNCLGIAVIASMLFSLNHHYLQQFLQHTHSTFANLHAKQIDGLLAASAKAKAAIAHFSATDIASIYTAAVNAYLKAFRHVMYFVALLGAVCWGMSMRMPIKKK